MTRTTVRFRGESKELPAEWEAYVWLLNRFLKHKPDLFTAEDADIKYLCCGGRNAPQFAASGRYMNQPKRLSNGWYAETCLNSDQKAANLYKLSQAIGVSCETDYEFQPDNVPMRERKDVATLFRELDALPTANGRSRR